jgi:Chlamydia polymorphic membrane protein (Chlamydia_PMP) repeat
LQRLPPIWRLTTPHPTLGGGIFNINANQGQGSDFDALIGLLPPDATVALKSPTIEIDYSTVSANTATDDGGGIYNKWI